MADVVQPAGSVDIAVVGLPDAAPDPADSLAAVAVSDELRQQQAAVQAAAQCSPTPQDSPPPAIAVVSQLERLAALQAQGILTPEEFAAPKAKIFNQS